VQVSPALAKTDAIFNEEHVVAYAGLEPVMRLAGRCGLSALAGEHVAIADQLGVNAPVTHRHRHAHDHRRDRDRRTPRTPAPPDLPSRGPRNGLSAASGRTGEVI
jgi:hypothetical protein